jgi:tetraprenyl-beta-curcumene synthase
MSSPLTHTAAPAIPEQRSGARRTSGHRLTARAAAALLLANIRFWLTVAPRVSSQVSRWQAAAEAIPDSGLREVALAKLVDERFNVEVAATLATLAPRRHRESVTDAIVALQVLYDYLDALGEQPGSDPLHEGERLVRAFTDAVAVGGVGTSKIVEIPRYDDDGYLADLARTVVFSLTSLPAYNAIAEVAQVAAGRCARAQILNHSVPTLGAVHAEEWASAQAEEWAAEETRGTGLGWQEYLAGASASVLSIHALIAAAADPGTTHADAVAIDAAYLSIGALTMLDSVVDYEEDLLAAQQGYLQYYDDPDRLSERLAWVARDATARARTLPHAAHHLMTLAGVGAYYLSSPGADTDFARPITSRVHDELRPLITPTLALMRTWRAARRVRG